MWSDILSVMQQHQRFIITTHTNPDLDALGSELALEEHLRTSGKQVSILNSDPVSLSHRFVDARRRIQTYRPRRHDPVIHSADVVFVLDASGGWNRVGRIGEVLAQTRATSVRIDHHPDPPRFTRIEMVDDGAAATAELIYELVCRACGTVTYEMAHSLYVAILTDSGSFKYPKTSPRTHRIAAELIERGVNPTELYDVVYNQCPLNRLRLQGHMMDSMQTAASGRVIWNTLDQNTLGAYGVKMADLDNLAGLGLQVVGIKVCVLCVEMPKGQVKNSMRSNGDVAVNGLAGEWGGGGHASASGATVKGSVEQVAAMVVSRVEALIDNGGSPPPCDDRGLPLFSQGGC